MGGMALRIQNQVIPNALPTISSQHLSETISLLTVPAEVRVRIYKILFSELILSPGWRDLGPGSRQALISHARRPPESTLVDLVAFDPGMDLEVGIYSPQRLRQPANLSILVACRKIYHEAYPVLLRFATFSLSTIEDHIRLTQPRFLPLLGQIHRLSVGSSILAEWSSTLVRLISPSLSHFEIRDLQSMIPHDYMLNVDSQLSNTGVLWQNEASLDTNRCLILLQRLLLNTDASVMAAVISHFTAAAEIYKCLVLHFKVNCFWGNMAPHEHPSKNCVFVFGETHIRAAGASLSTLPPAQWTETSFIFNESFSLAHGIWDPSTSPRGVQ